MSILLYNCLRPKQNLGANELYTGIRKQFIRSKEFYLRFFIQLNFTKNVSIFYCYYSCCYRIISHENSNRQKTYRILISEKYVIEMKSGLERLQINCVLLGKYQQKEDIFQVNLVISSWQQIKVDEKKLNRNENNMS